MNEHKKIFIYTIVFIYLVFVVLIEAGAFPPDNTNLKYIDKYSDTNRDIDLQNLNIVIYANSQAIGIKHFLLKQLLNPSIYIIRSDETNEQTLPIQNIKNADVFIFQFLSTHNTLSTDLDFEPNIFKYVKPTCKLFGFPPIVQTAFWPLISDLEITDGHEIIHELKRSKTLDSIIKMYKNNKIDFKLQERFDKYENDMKSLEHKYSIYQQIPINVITVSKFIRDNYQTSRLFLSPNKPSSYIFLHIANEILQMCNFKITISNIFNYRPKWGKSTEIYQDSNYTKTDLDLKYITQTHETTFIKLIPPIYNAITPHSLGCVITVYKDKYASSALLFVNRWKYLFPEIEIVIILIATSIPLELVYIEDHILLFDPIENIPDEFVINNIQALYPTIVDCDTSIMTVDMDVIPLNIDFLNNTLRLHSNNTFIAFRNSSICYNIGLNTTWQTIFKIYSFEDIRKSLIQQYTDSKTIQSYEHLSKCLQQDIVKNDFIQLNDIKTNFNRLMGPFESNFIFNYSDYKFFEPCSEYHYLNNIIIKHLQ